MAEVFGEKLLEGKVAIVTGGGSGINLAIATRYAQSGAKVALIGRTKEKLDAAADGIRKAGGIASGQLRCDDTTAATWLDESSSRWTLFFLEWDPGPTASRVLATTHRPEICLSAIGMKLTADRGVLEVRGAGLPLHFHAYTFEQEGRPVFVYYGVWQIRAPRPSRQGTLSESPHRASVQAVLWRERNLGQQVAELVVSGYNTAEQADAAFQEAIEKLFILRVPSVLAAD